MGSESMEDFPSAGNYVIIVKGELGEEGLNEKGIKNCQFLLNILIDFQGGH